MVKRKGWNGESQRHSMASKGVKTKIIKTTKLSAKGYDEMSEYESEARNCAYYDDPDSTNVYCPKCGKGFSTSHENVKNNKEMECKWCNLKFKPLKILSCPKCASDVKVSNQYVSSWDRGKKTTWCPKCKETIKFDATYSGD